MTLKTNTQVIDASKDKEVEQPTSVRDSIRAAVDERREIEEKEDKLKSSNEDDEDDKEDKKIEENKSTDKKEDDDKEEKEETKEDDDKEEKEETKEDEDKKEKVSASSTEKGKRPIPIGVPKEAREKWRDLPDDIQSLIIETQRKAINDTKADMGRQSPHIREVETVLAPRMQEMREIGVTPAQIVKKIFEYADGLAGPKKYDMIQSIAKDFNIDLTRFGKSSKQTQGQENTDPQTDAEDDLIVDLPAATHAKLDKLLAEQEANSNVARKAADDAARDTVHRWSGYDPATGEHKNKPYFEHVRQTMFAIMKANTIPLKEGRLDLDAIYDAAVYSNPEIREIMEENRKLEQEKIEADRKKKEKKKQDIANAKSKNLSLRPSASSISSRSQQINGQAKGNSQSVRQSIMSAIQESR